jgi:hypothetical protein
MATVREMGGDGGDRGDGGLYVIRDFAIHKANDQYSAARINRDFSGALKSSFCSTSLNPVVRCGFFCFIKFHIELSEYIQSTMNGGISSYSTKIGTLLESERA